MIHKSLLIASKAGFLWRWKYKSRGDKTVDQITAFVNGVFVFMYCGMIFITGLPMKRQGMFALDGSLLCSMHTTGGWRKRRVCSAEWLAQ